VLVNEKAGENSWGVRFLAMFHMANDSELFVSEPREGYVPLYEAKMIWQFDHRLGTYKSVSDRNSTHLPTPAPEQYANPHWTLQPWYWVPVEEVEARLEEKWQEPWLLAYRRITNATNERTVIMSVIPRVGAADPAMVMLLRHDDHVLEDDFKSF